MRLLWADMRPQDIDEVTAASGPDLLGTLLKSLDDTPDPIAGYAVNGPLLWVFGLVPVSMSSDRAVGWLLGTNAMTDYHDVLARGARVYIRQALLEYRELFNYVDARNKWSLTWLKRLGFTIDPPEKYGVEDRMFHKFYIERETL